MLRTVLAAAATAAAFVGLIGAATAAPVTRVDSMNHTQVSSHGVFVQTVHWERRGHRRVWVPDHRRPVRGYDRR